MTLFEQKIAALEHAEDAIGFPSGMAAISGAVLAFVQPQDRVVCVRHVYPDAYRFFETLLKKFGVTVEYVDGGRSARGRCRAGGRQIALPRESDELDHAGARGGRFGGTRPPAWRSQRNR